MSQTPAGLRDTLQEVRKPADYLRAARSIRESAPGGLRALRVGLVGSCTLQFLEPYLVVEGARADYYIETSQGQFGQFEQEVGSRESALLRQPPDVVVLLLRPEDVAPELTARPVDPSPALGGLVERLRHCVRLLRQHSGAPVLVANFAMPPVLPLGVFDANLAESLAHAFARANMQLRAALADEAGAFVWDYAGLVTTHGTAQWTDRRLWALARIPVAAAMQPHLAKHLLRTVTGVLRPPAKCLVLDLDNTLWGGAIGDDGMSGIILGDEHPGSAYKAFQRYLRGLADRGVLLAVASKNERKTVEEVFRRHPEMLLREEDIAAWRVNWEPKSGNLRALAAELNIGADALVFFDDNPVERAEVQAGAPEVAVIDAPSDPLLYPQALMDSGYFDQPVLSAEDRARTSMYRADHGRRNLEAHAGSVEDFLRGLEMVATIGQLDAAVLGRVAQLVNKTNQFNLTTRRHSESDLAAMGREPSRVVAWLRLRDRFGDQGLVAVGILAAEGGIARIDLFLMSCRVMGRHVEQALLAFLVEQARRLGCQQVVGDFLPTRKNAMVQEFYPRAGFEPAGADAATGGMRYRLALNAATVAWPDVIAREEGAGSAVAEMESAT
jgi:FkbH-like protein